MTPPSYIKLSTWSAADLLRSLQSGICPICGKFKEHRHSLCADCFLALSQTARRRLYDRIGAGYEHAIAQAAQELGVIELTLPISPIPSGKVVPT